MDRIVIARALTRLARQVMAQLPETEREFRLAASGLFKKRSGLRMKPLGLGELVSRTHRLIWHADVNKRLMMLVFSEEDASRYVTPSTNPQTVKGREAMKAVASAFDGRYQETNSGASVGFTVPYWD